MRYTLGVCVIAAANFANAQAGKGMEQWSGSAEQAAFASKSGATIPLSTYSIMPTKVNQKKPSTGTVVGGKPAALVCLFDSDWVAGPTLATAKRVAEKVLASAGILVRVEDGNAQVHLKSPVFPTESRGGRETIDVRFIYATPASQKPGSLATSLPYARNGTRITIFFDRVEKFGEHGPQSVPRVLGHVLAHEIGHILLRTDEHSPGGIMKAHWDEHDYRLITGRGLTFSAENAADMQSRFEQTRFFTTQSSHAEAAIEQIAWRGDRSSGNETEIVKILNYPGTIVKGG